MLSKRRLNPIDMPLLRGIDSYKKVMMNNAHINFTMSLTLGILILDYNKLKSQKNMDVDELTQQLRCLTEDKSNSLKLISFFFFF